MLNLGNIDIEIKKEKVEEDKIEQTEVKKNSDNNTAILDKNEISNIKNLLDDNSEIDENLSLDDFMSSTASVDGDKKAEIKSEATIETSKKRKKKKKLKKAGSKVIVDSLGSLPVDELRRLLLGAEVQITIKFPKE